MEHSSQLHKKVISFLILSVMLVLVMSSNCMATVVAPYSHTAMMKETDVVSLLAFKKEVIFDPYNVLSSWNNSLHLCSWHGVTCGPKHQRVRVLDLSSGGLEGTLTPHLGNLTFLRGLYLYNNSFHGSLPAEVEKLTNINLLNISNNRLSGTIPQSLGSCLALEFLYLDNNAFEGSIPPSLQALKSLQHVDLSCNKLVGQIPAYFTMMKNLKYLNLSFNNLEGDIPTEGVFKNLSAISLEGNRKLCGIPCTERKSDGNTIYNYLEIFLRAIIHIIIIVIAYIIMRAIIIIFRKKKQQEKSLSREPVEELKMSTVESSLEVGIECSKNPSLQIKHLEMSKYESRNDKEAV